MEDKNATAYVLSGMGDVALDRGDLALARTRYEEALALRSQAGEKQNAAESRVSLAKVTLEEGHASEAEAPVRACIEEFKKEQQADDELSARTVLIDALLAQAKQREAQQEMEAAQRLGKESQNRFLCLHFELASGRVLMKSAHPEAAPPFLTGLNRDAQRYRFAGLEFESKLALAELARKRITVSRPKSSCMACRNHPVPKASD
jgi:ATP/maltotriose-dependent transcriptional regulator MalT